MEFTVGQIASLVNGSVEGDAEAGISSFAKIEEGHTGAISFLANEKYTPYIYTTGSSAVLVRRDFKPEHPVKTTLIRVDDPYATVAHLLRMVSDMMNPPRRGVEQPSFISAGVEIPDDAYIGAFAYIGNGVRLGRGVQIYPQVYIGDGVVIGDNVTLYPGVRVYRGCRLGNRVTIHAGSVIGADGFGFAPVDGHYEKIPQIGIVEIADDVEIGANTTIDRATMGATRIARGVKLDNLIQIGHNVEVGESTVMAAQAGVAGSAKIGSHCMFGGQVGVAGHITVGDDVQVAAQSGIKDGVASGSRLFGSPAMDLRKYARQIASIDRIPDILSRLKALEKAADTGN